MNYVVYYENNGKYRVNRISYENFLTHQYRICDYYLKCNICGDKFEVFGMDTHPDQIPEFECYADFDLSCNEVLIKNIVE